MKICHVSFGEIRNTTAAKWLKTVPYFTHILAKMGEMHQVYSFHYSLVTETNSFQNVNYRFLKTSLQERLLLYHLLSSVRSLNPDVIVLHGFHSSLQVYRFVSVMKDFKIFVQHHGEKIFGFPKGLVQKRIDKNVSGYFFSSSEMGEEWVRAGLIRNSGKILEVLEITSSFLVDGNQIVRSEKLNFIWVGRLDTNKDPLTLIEGFISFLKVQPSANLYLIFGTQDLLSEVKAKAHGFQNNIHLVGTVPHTEIPKWYTKCDFIISTSLFEAAGVSVVEGMSCGCIPVLSDIPSFRKISGDGKIGLLFSRNSPAALTAALVNAVKLNVINERKKMLAYFETHLSPAAVANRIINFAAVGSEKVKSSALL